MKTHASPLTLPTIRPLDRRLLRWPRLLAPLLVSCATFAFAAAPPPASFKSLGQNTKITGASTDGSVLCGTYDASPDSAFRYLNGAVSYLPSRPGNSGASASAISANGRVVVGYSGYTAPAYVLVRWVDGGAPQTLGSLAGATGTAGIGAVSADGSVIAGTIGDAAYPVGEVFRWTQAGGMAGIGMLTGGKSPAIRGMSADGSLIVGECAAPHPTVTDRTIRKAWRWTSATGLTALSTLPGDNETTVVATFSDGTALGRSRYVGSAGYFNGKYEDGSVALDSVVQWDTAGAISVPALPAGVISANPQVASPDGSAILGAGGGGRVVRWTRSGVEVLGSGATHIGGSYLTTDGSVLYVSGLLWDADNGERQLKDVLLETYGVEEVRRWREFNQGPAVIRRTGDTLLIAGQAFTPDLGTAERPTTLRGGWVATIPVPVGTAVDPFAGDMLTKTSTFTPGASFKEHYAEFVLSHRFPATVDDIGLPEPAHTKKYPAGRWNAAITATGSLAGLDLATLSADTPVRLLLGDYFFSSTLGAASNWAPGKTKATFTGFNGTNVTVAWDARQVTFTVRGATADRIHVERDPDFGDSVSVDGLNLNQIEWVAFPNYFDRKAPQFPTQDVFLRLGMGFAGRTGARDLVLSGAGKSRLDRSIDPGDGTAGVYLRTVDLTAVLDVTPPTASWLSPADKSVFFGPQLSVRAKLNRVSSVAIRINGGDYETRSFRFQNQDYYTGEWQWSSLQMVPGANLIEIKVSDASGNESAPLKRTVTYSTLEGAYSGLVQTAGPDGEVAGYFTLSTSRKNTFTGKLRIDGRTHAFAGAFAADGAVTVNVSRGKLPPIALHLQATVPDDGRTTVAGAFSLDSANYGIDAGRAKLLPFSGTGVVVLPPDFTQRSDATLPRGTGVLKVVVAASGAVRLAGRLADGKPISFSGVMDARGNVPFYVPLAYQKATGLLAGVAEWKIGPAGYPVFRGTSNWHKPAQPGAARFPQAFTIDSDLEGGSVSLAPFEWPGGIGGFARIRDDETVLLEKALTLRGSAPVVTAPGADKLSLKFKSGLATGTVILPGQTKAAGIFSGSYYVGQNRASTRGYCLDTTASHEILLLPIQ